MRSARWPNWWWGFAGSVGLHALLWAWAVVASDRAPARREVVPIRLELRTQPAPAPEPPAPLEVAEAPAPRRTPARRREPPPEPRAEPSRSPAPPPSGSSAPATPGDDSPHVVAPPSVDRLPDDAAGGVSVGTRGSGGVSGSAEGSVRDLAELDLDAHPATPMVDPLLPAQPKAPPGGASRFPLHPTGGGGFRYEDPTFSARIAPDGQVTIHDRGSGVSLSPGEASGPRNVGEPVVIKPPSLSVAVDITDIAMRLSGEDPYLHRKLTFLKETSDFRARLADAACKRRLKRAILGLKQDLARIWADESLSPEARRAKLFQVWDDCAEAHEDTEQVVGYAEQARATVVAFIRAQLPASSSVAYSHRELLAFNRGRRSDVLFDPYGSIIE